MEVTAGVCPGPGPRGGGGSGGAGESSDSRSGSRVRLPGGRKPAPSLASRHHCKHSVHQGYFKLKFVILEKKGKRLNM